jgi:ornithine carbamoyltransferase
MDLKGRNFLTLKDFSPEEILHMVDLAAALKAKKKAGELHEYFRGKNIALIFEKTSTRTRCSFEVAGHDLGMGVTYLDPTGSQIGKKESIADTARVLSRMFDGIEYRGYGQEKVTELAKYASVPVWNGLTNEFHPTQILADIMTIEEHVDKALSDVKVVFVGDIRNNMSYAWMYGCAKMGMKFAAYGPEELAEQVDASVLAKANAVAAETGAEIVVSSDPECLKGADVIYTDIWASMGEEDQIPERVKLLTPYKVTEELMASTGNPDCLFMHCLPSFHNFDTTMAAEQMKLGYDIREVTEEVFSGPNSVVFDEAENRLHSIKAVIVATIGE